MIEAEKETKMLEIGRMTEYDADVAAMMGELLMDLSESYDGEPVTREWVEEIIESPWHDVLLAVDDGKVVGMASVSVVMGALIERNEYLEDFVVSAACQGKGVGSQLWEQILAWGREKGCKKLEFTSSGKGKKQGAVEFYQSKGAEIRDTNAFTIEL